MLRPRGDHVFFGAWEPDAPATGIGERFLRLLPTTSVTGLRSTPGPPRSPTSSSRATRGTGYHPEGPISLDTPRPDRSNRPSQGRHTGSRQANLQPARYRHLPVRGRNHATWRTRPLWFVSRLILGTTSGGNDEAAFLDHVVEPPLPLEAAPNWRAVLHRLPSESDRCRGCHSPVATTRTPQRHRRLPRPGLSRPARGGAQRTPLQRRRRRRSRPRSSTPESS